MTSPLIADTDFPLTPSSVVFDLGTYTGNWSHAIWERYQPHLHLFEPVPEFLEEARAKLPVDPKIRLYGFGLAPDSREAVINVHADSSSMYAHHGLPQTRISLKRMDEYLAASGIGRIDLMKVNIEGAEYDLFDHMISSGIVDLVTNFLVQFHDFMPGARARYDSIASSMARTHERIGDDPFYWVIWRRR